MRTAPEILADLGLAFPRQEVTRGTFDVYVRELADVPPDVLEEAVREVIRTSEWFPSISAIRGVVAERTLAIPSESEALTQVFQRMAWAREDAAERAEEPPQLHPIVREAVDQVGGFAEFRSAEQAGVIRSQFQRLYRDARSEAIHRARVGSASHSIGQRPPALS